MGKVQVKRCSPTHPLEEGEVGYCKEKEVLLVGRGDGTNREIGENDLSLPMNETPAQDLEPEVYQVYGEVSSLSVNLVEKPDGRVHEYCFEFIPAEGFAGLTITPDVRWVDPPTFPVGKTCQVSVLRGVAIMVYA